MKKRSLMLILSSVIVLTSVNLFNKQNSTISSKKDFTVGIIGVTGHVGRSTAHAFIHHDGLVSKLLLWGRNQEKCEGEVGDLQDANGHLNVVQAKDITDIASADVIIITAGEKQKPGGQTRDELLAANKDITKDIIAQLSQAKEKNDKAVVIIVSNPPEDLAQCALMQAKELGYLSNPEKQIIASGTSLDTRRLLNNLASYCNVPRESIQNGFVLGEHGDAQFPVWSQMTIPGFTLSEQDKKDIQTKTRKKAYNIIDRKGYTQFGVSSCLVDICKVIKGEEEGPIAVSVFDPQEGVYLSLPTYLNREGVKEIVRLKLNEKEKESLAKCIKKRKDNMHKLV